MAHQRKLIRQAAVAKLIAAATSAGARVYPTRVAPLRKDLLPAIAVYTEDEEVDPDSEGTSTRELKRYVELVVEGYVAHTSALSADDGMDDLAEQIEAAIDADPNLNSTVGDHGCFLERTETGFADGSSDPLIGVVKLTYRALYRTSPAEAGSSPTDAFLTADVKYTPPGGVADTPVLEDTVTVQEP